VACAGPRRWEGGGHYGMIGLNGGLLERVALTGRPRTAAACGRVGQSCQGGRRGPGSMALASTVCFACCCGLPVRPQGCSLLITGEGAVLSDTLPSVRPQRRASSARWRHSGASSSRAWAGNRWGGRGASGAWGNGPGVTGAWDASGCIGGRAGFVGSAAEAAAAVLQPPARPTLQGVEGIYEFLETKYVCMGLGQDSD